MVAVVVVHPLLAVTVYAVAELVAEGDPVIAPVDVFNDNPVGKAGETE
jgi:hypothetical protein